MSGELTSAMIKKFATETLRVDKVGVANIERFDGAPADMSPRSIMPNAKSVVVFVKRILRGSQRGIDEGTHWPSYTVFCYSGLNAMLGKAKYKLARFIEDHGYEAAGLSSGATSREMGPRGPETAPDKPRREVSMQHRIAATLAGLGEIGWSKVFLTEEFGPRQRIGIILTDAELEPDPIRVGHLCDRCKRCVAECPGMAIPKDKAVSIEVEGHRIEWGDIDLGKCKLTHFGLTRRNAPHTVRAFPGLYLPIPEQEVTWLESWELGWAFFNAVPTFKALADRGGPPALCGARGCIIGCMKHMEARGKVKNKFVAQPVFSEKKPWALPDKPAHTDHNGFVYDPETGEDLRKRSAEVSLDASTWY